MAIIGCDFVNNGGDGVRLDGNLGGNDVYVENSNFVGNAGVDGRLASTSYYEFLYLLNCGFLGAADMGITTSGLIKEEDSVIYDAVPYADESNDNFTVVRQAVGAGRGNFHPSFPTESYPDIGAAPALHVDVRVKRPNALVRR